MPCSDETLRLLPGILSRGENFQALGFDLERVVDYNAFDPKSFDARLIVHDVATLARLELVEGCGVTLVGASLGGMLIPFIVKELRRSLPRDLLRGFRCVIIDAPFGVESMIATGGSPFVGRVIRSPFGHLLRPLTAIKVGPKDQYIEIPDAAVMQEIAGETRTDAGWRDYVKRRAIEELSGHSSMQWLSQLRWMTRVGHDGSLRCACEAMDGVDATYVACMGEGNDVVKQPLARDWWVDAVPTMRQYPLASAVHCGFVQQAPLFRGALAEILG